MLVAFVFFLQKKYTTENRKKFFLLAIVAALGGCIFSLLRFPGTDKTLPPHTNARPAKVIHVSPRSAIIKFTDNQTQTRLVNLPADHGLLRSDLVEVSCQSFIPTEKIFQILDSLQGTNTMCSLQSFRLLSERGIISNYFLHIRKLITDNLAQALPPESLARGVLLADTTAIDSYELSLYRNMGIAHLFAASGLHLGLIFGLFFIPFRLIQRPAIGLIAGFLAATFFLLLLEAPVSLVRAYIFLLFYLIREFSDHQIARESILFLAAIITEMLYPLSTFSISFILSFGVTGSIMLFFSDLRRFFAPVRFRPLADHLALTLAAFAASAPLSALLFFGGSGPAALFYNFLAVPVAGLYLVAVIATSLVPHAAPLVKAGDFFYQHLALLHSQTLHAFLPPVPEAWSIVWGIGIFFLCLTFWYRANYSNFWVAKKIPQFGLPAMLLAYYLPLLIANPLPEASRVIPGMVLEYKNREIYAFGRPAPFLEQKQTRIFELPQWPVRKVYLPAELTERLPPLLQKQVSLTPTTETQDGLLRGRLGCYLFFSTIHPERWRPDELAGCNRLFLVLSNRDKQRVADLTPLVRHFHYKEEIVTLGYFRWQTIPPKKSTE